MTHSRLMEGCKTSVYFDKYLVSIYTQSLNNKVHKAALSFTSLLFKEQTSLTNVSSNKAFIFFSCFMTGRKSSLEESTGSLIHGTIYNFFFPTLDRHDYGGTETFNIQSLTSCSAFLKNQECFVTDPMSPCWPTPMEYMVIILPSFHLTPSSK